MEETKIYYADTGDIRQLLRELLLEKVLRMRQTEAMKEKDAT